MIAVELINARRIYVYVRIYRHPDDTFFTKAVAPLQMWYHCCVSLACFCIFHRGFLTLVHSTVESAVVVTRTEAMGLALTVICLVLG